MKKLELLAPAGSLQICKAVIRAGADAVYLGGNQFGARAYAQNFDQPQLLEALDDAHMFGRKIFLTVNTLLKDPEIEKDLYQYIVPYYEHGLDAVIVQDFGVLSFLHREFPDLPLHASTQMSVTNALGAEVLKECGVSRIVTARELSLFEIRDLYEKTGMEIESFIHGALCYCYSGQCLFSSMLGGRSGNRGRCAQPCRLNYQVVDKKNRCYNPKEGYPLSPRDLCTLDLLPGMAQAGVYSYKIEGRMKQMEYAAGVTAIYRKYLDLYEQDPSQYRVSPKDMQYLMDLGNRNGFTKGYYEMRNDRSMLSLTSSAHKSGSNKEMQPLPELKKHIIGQASFCVGQPAVLTVSDGIHTISVEKSEVLEAKKQPLTAADVSARLKKTGDTPYVFGELDVSCDEDAFLPVKQINELRRAALEQLTGECLKEYRRKLQKNKPVEPRGNVCCGSGRKDVGYGKMAGREDAVSFGQEKEVSANLSVLVRTPEQFREVLKADEVDAIEIECDCFGTMQDLLCGAAQARERGKSVVYCLPPVLRLDSADRYKNWGEEVWNCFDGVLVRTYDGLGFAKTYVPEHVKIYGDHSLYQVSDEAAKAFERCGVNQLTASLELNERELSSRICKHAEMVIYGWIPLMTTAQCIYKNFDGCRKQGRGSEEDLWLLDRYFKKFLITRNCKDCYNVIYNSQPLYLLHHAQKIQNMRYASYRIEFLQESASMVQKILREYRQAFLNHEKLDMSGWENRFTNGHFKKGVE